MTQERDIQRLYAERLNRYVTAMRNEKPDKVPVRPFAAEFAAKYAGYTCQQVTHDYNMAFDAVRRCAGDFDWDATVGNMVYVWTGLTQAIGLKYYSVPGAQVPPDMPFQYLEPKEHDAHMLPDEYDQLIEDPTGFLFNVWLPRVSGDVCAPGAPCTYRNNLSFLKGGMSMLSYFNAFGPQNDALKNECGTVSAIAGILKAPFDILADKLRGYVGLVTDMLEQPEKVKAACEALAPHLLFVALAGADPDGYVPIGHWMHRSCIPFISQEQFETFHWPTLRKIVESIWNQGHQVLFYAEGDWNAHLETFTELPEGSIVFHVDHADVFEVHKRLGHKFCVSGGIPNFLLAYGTPDEVRDHCKKVIDEVAPDGGYIIDAGAIMQTDSRTENVEAMTDAAREFGVYHTQPSTATPPKPSEGKEKSTGSIEFDDDQKIPPGICVPWSEKRGELGQILGDEEILERVWNENETLAYLYAWHCLVSF